MLTHEEGRLRFLRRRRQSPPPRVRRGVYLLPSLFTLGNMFCGYACIVYAMRGEYETAAPFIGFALVLDMLDGRIARLTGGESAFGLQFDSLADVISFGVAPAVLSLGWGLAPLGRLGWAVAFMFVASAAIRLARFNIQSPGADKRYFVGMPSPTAAAIPASTVYVYPSGIHDYWPALLVILVVVVPSLLMVSKIRFRSFKTFDLQTRRPYSVLLVIAAGIVLVTTHPRYVLVVMAYTYLASAFIGMALTRLRRRDGRVATSVASAPQAAGHDHDRDSAAG
jgi:CDP-diacylglycerol---serine O-phosphatidyltransferase